MEVNAVTQRENGKLLILYNIDMKIPATLPPSEACVGKAANQNLANVTGLPLSLE